MPATTPVPDLPEWDKRVRLGFEREMLGLYVSDHPLQGLEHILAAQRDLQHRRAASPTTDRATAW